MPCWMTCKLDISRAAKLVSQLYPKGPKAWKGSQAVFLGVARLNSFDGSMVSGPQWVILQGGTGKILVSLEYAHVEDWTLDIDTSDYVWLGPSGVEQVKRQGTQQRYARRTMKGAQLGSLSKVAAQISPPFVPSLTFTRQSTRGFELYTPFVSGGPLLSHLQEPQRFGVERARLYAVEMVCALEYLHNTRWDISLFCGFGLFTRQRESSDQVTHGRPEYPATELLVDHKNTPRAADWWTLYVFLYGMPTGLPPFYDNNAEKVQLNILNQPLEFPNSLPSLVTYILSKLLNQDPGQRSGAGGTVEAKGHPFFEDIDWSKLMQRGYQPVFKPGYSAMRFLAKG
ncbi:kinase-like domain-containing protein [Chaetomium tenue]|uniref:Kinase-like domain-containing protein n=1 Tax=Chaetomium tenue TaxID=1854479 RepID=A0ACB7PN90_9PEZI|nr:kinase-like domain-containing protein [Chaetomium globosum]